MQKKFIKKKIEKSDFCKTGWKFPNELQKEYQIKFPMKFSKKIQKVSKGTFVEIIKAIHKQRASISRAF